MGFEAVARARAMYGNHPMGTATSITDIPLQRIDGSAAELADPGLDAVR